MCTGYAGKPAAPRPDLFLLPAGTTRDVPHSQNVADTPKAKKHLSLAVEHGLDILEAQICDRPLPAGKTPVHHLPHTAQHLSVTLQTPAQAMASRRTTLASCRRGLERLPAKKHEKPPVPPPDGFSAASTCGAHAPTRLKTLRQAFRHTAERPSGNGLTEACSGTRQSRCSAVPGVHNVPC